MPFYDYVCQSCGRRIEVMHSVHATGPERCDACGGRLTRAISRPAIHFKGSGWAKMDARAQAGKMSSADAPAEGRDGEAVKEATASDGESTSAAPAAADASGEPAAAAQADAGPADGSADSTRSKRSSRSTRAGSAASSKRRA